MNTNLKKKSALLSSYLVLTVTVAAELERMDQEYFDYIESLIRKNRQKKNFFPRYRAPRLAQKTWNEYCESLDDTTFRRMF
jgi:hypothetical protein